MRVDHHAGNAEAFAEHYVRSLPSHAIELDEFRLGFWDDAVVVVDNLLAGAVNIFRFHPIEATGLNVFLQFFGWNGDERLSVLVFLKQGFCHDVDAIIRTLCGQYCGNEELERGTVDE